MRKRKRVADDVPDTDVSSLDSDLLGSESEYSLLETLYNQLLVNNQAYYYIFKAIVI